MRTKNSIRNILIALCGQVFGTFVTFVSRMIFVQMLGAEYLGVSGLFMNILSMLSLAEMGFGSAIIYSLYKPLAVQDHTKIKGLMNFYASAYRIIGFIVLGIGLSLLPFLDFIIKDTPDVANLRLIYLLYLASSVVTYFFAHKRSLIIADQKNYIVTLYKYSFFVVLNISQIVILVITKNFLFFLLAQVLFGFLENLAISLKAGKSYPFLNDCRGFQLDKDSRVLILRNVRAMFYHRLGGVVVNGTDNILISSLVGVVWVGLYSNYNLIINALNTILSQVFSSVTASVGNLNALEDKSKSLSVYKSMFFANFWLFGYCAISLLILLNPFITLWLGDQYVMDNYIVLLIVINFYNKGLRKTTLIFRDSLGLFWNDRYKPVFESVINLAASVFLAKYLGITGIFLGTFISNMTTCFWVEPYILFKHGFNCQVKEYFVQYSVYFFVLFISGILTWLASSVFPEVTLAHFIGRAIVCLVIPNAIIVMCFYSTTEFKHLYAIASRVLSKKSRRSLSGLAKNEIKSS